MIASIHQEYYYNTECWEKIVMIWPHDMDTIRSRRRKGTRNDLVSADVQLLEAISMADEVVQSGGADALILLREGSRVSFND